MEQIVLENAIGKVTQDPINNHKSLISKHDYCEGDLITNFSYSKVFDKPNRYTVQIEDDAHIILEPLFLQYINHSCEPNAFFDTSSFNLVCIKDIKVGEEFNFFYPSTEWDMDEQFECHCQTPSCLGKIQGAKYIPADRLADFRFTEYIQKKLSEGNKRVITL